MNDVDYAAVEIPEGKPPGEYHWTERRAEILQLIKKAGHPDSISPTRLANRYDVTKGQISQDKDRLRDHITNQLNEGRVDAITATVFENAIKELIENDEYRKAAKTAAEWHDWMADRGHVPREPDRLELSGADDWRAYIRTGDDEADD
ncbi:hypothetical protein [Halanaeroarchaeum sulfurireducens]|uniref:Uncharacterized protein n=1 Tax=Halanaeroarchaeum sulfurireducens TaxID=1604004 RepID=A0A0N9NC06_9EURY|nr:hypothetical protein [Halanaeroarchaeum sulfurireducens]ALG82918.1 hypothetical protein HLASA_2043 [Halanaeroarchaeum sulfurireducens]